MKKFKNIKNFIIIGTILLSSLLITPQVVKIDNVANNLSNSWVIPGGELIGMRLYSKGVLIVGVSEINGKKPYKKANLKEGDLILEINGQHVESAKEVSELTSKLKSKNIKIKFLRNGEEKETTITAVKDSKGNYKLGIWVRDSAAGIGTVTFYNPETQTFIALGHGILDVDTEQIFPIENGEIFETNIVSIEKGKKGKPGKISGTIVEKNLIGNLKNNTSNGITGIITGADSINLKEKIKIASRKEIKVGKATILCNVNNQVEEYEIEIKQIYSYSNSNKSMLIQVTDSRLLEKTGGIIQGMSGSPVMQNSKLIGALTHVQIDDPTSGYAIFAELLLKTMEVKQ